MSRRTVRVVGPENWILWPALLCIGATVLFATPIRLFGLPPPEPVFPMVLAFAWPLIRPSVLAPAALFGAGVFLDLLWDGPLGLWPLCLLAVYGAVLAVRSLLIGQETPVLFAWYAGLTAAVFLLASVFVSLDSGASPSIVSVVLQYLPTLCLFPLAVRLIQSFDDGDVRFR